MNIQITLGDIGQNNKHAWNPPSHPNEFNYSHCGDNIKSIQGNTSINLFEIIGQLKEDKTKFVIMANQEHIEKVSPLNQ